ncbi:MAG: SusE domain-containing protein [Bacteroidota bacterium]
MKNKILLFLTIIGLAGLFTACEEDGTRVVMSENPIPPSIQSVPNLTLVRSNANNTVAFIGTPVDPGFTASATYFLEACVSGNGFADYLEVYTGPQDTLIDFTVSELNGILLRKFDADVTTSVDFRIRAILTVDAGTSAPGTGSDPFEYISDLATADITIFGLPRLDLTGTDQKIESAAGDGVYSGFVKLGAGVDFTLTDPDTETSYGFVDDETIEVDGAAYSVATAGWYKFSVNTNDLTFTLTPYMIGVVGSATPNGWGAPDIKMDYDAKAGTWSVITTLADGEFKFRRNDDWAWNLGGTTDNLTHNGANIAVSAGTYLITLKITNDATGSEAGTFTIAAN